MQNGEKITRGTERRKILASEIDVMTCTKGEEENELAIKIKNKVLNRILDEASPDLKKILIEEIEVHIEEVKQEITLEKHREKTETK